MIFSWFWKTNAILAPRIELAANLERLMHFGRPFANADRENHADSCFPRASKHRFTIIGVARAIQVGVRIDQQSRLIDYMGKFGSARTSLVQQKWLAEWGRGPQS